MRKLLSIIIISMLLISIFSFNSSAVLRQKQADVSYGTPVIDGVMDDCYKNSSEIVIEYRASVANNATDDMESARGVVRLCWDENNMYLYLEVVDKTPVTQPLSNFGSDAFECVFDFDNNNSDVDSTVESFSPNGIFVKTLAYAKTVGSPEFENDLGNGMGTEHHMWFIDLPANEHEVVCVIKPDGYIIERRIPVNDAVKAMFKPGYSCGFQIWLLDDIDDNNQRDFKLSWGEPTDEVGVGNYNKSASCDQINFIAAPPPVIEIEEVEEAEAAGETVVTSSPVTSTSPQTADPIILMSLLAFAGAVGLAGLKRKK
ncbi:MAG: hypothetical protein FWF15_01665 [Oscillospiraceae bacterium]|nr:hypothetical protein [Oscillospiraceae bacterium]